MEEPRVSIIVPCYKNHHEIEKTLKSIFSQCYSNLELILSDDCTPGGEESWKRVEQFALDNMTDNILQYKIVRYDVNQGTAKHCNADLELVTGEYVKLLPPGDEFYECDTLLKCVQEMIKHDSRILVGQTYMKRRNENNENDVVKDSVWYRWKSRSGRMCNVTPSNRDLEYLKKISSEESNRIIASRPIISTIAVMFRTDLLRETKGFPTKWRLIEDVAYWPQLALNGECFHFEKIRMVKYSLSGCSNTGNADSEFSKDLRDILKTVYIPNEYRGDFLKRLRLKELEFLEVSQKISIFRKLKYSDIYVYRFMVKLKYLLTGSRL